MPKRTHMNANTSLRMNPELVYNRLESWTVYRSLRVTRRKIQYVKVPMAIPAKAPTRTSPRKCTPKYVLINELAAAQTLTERPNNQSLTSHMNSTASPKELAAWLEKNP